MDNLRKTIYLAGKVSGLVPEVATMKFNAVANRLRQENHRVFDPCEIIPAGTEWVTAMKVLIPYVCSSDVIYLQPDWRTSKGARAELDVAVVINLEVIYPDYKALWNRFIEDIRNKYNIDSFDERITRTKDIRHCARYVFRKITEVNYSFLEREIASDRTTWMHSVKFVASQRGQWACEFNAIIDDLTDLLYKCF